MTIEQHIDILIYIENNFDKQTSDILFDTLSDHIYTKWTNSNYSILTFISKLDFNNRKLLIDWGEQKLDYFIKKYNIKP
jgi:hypothetical protein